VTDSRQAPAGTGFNAVVLAADRNPDDPVALETGVACKCLAPVGGRPMVLRVLDALAAARLVQTRTLCGPGWASVQAEAALRRPVEAGQIRWLANADSPSRSTQAALEALPETEPALVTTADHALLSAGMVDYFLERALAGGCDLAVAVATRETVSAAYPDTLRTYIRLRGGAYSGCNLFAFVTPRARRAAAFWQRIENQRKQPLRVIGAVGWSAIVRYLSGTLTLEAALSGLSRRMGLKVGVIPLPYAEAAIDVDSAADRRLAESIITARQG
jgi:GTP:adenosylcobinamide-phosphate guanylyltransferase